MTLQCIYIYIYIYSRNDVKPSLVLHADPHFSVLLGVLLGMYVTESNFRSDFKCVRHDLMIDAVSPCIGWTYLPIRTRHPLSDIGIFEIRHSLCRVMMVIGEIGHEKYVLKSLICFVLIILL